MKTVFIYIICILLTTLLIIKVYKYLIPDIPKPKPKPTCYPKDTIIKMHDYKKGTEMNMLTYDKDHKCCNPGELVMKAAVQPSAWTDLVCP